MFFPRKNQVFIHISSSKIFLVLGQENNKKLTIQKLAQFDLAGEELKTFVKEEKLRKKEIKVVLGGEELFSRIILIPEVPKKEIKQILAWELRKYLSIGWEEEEIVFDYYPLGPMEFSLEKLQGYLVVGGRKKYIQSFVDYFTNLGLTIKMVNVEAMVLKYLYGEFKGLKKSHDCCFYLTVSRAVLTFFQNEELIYTINFKFNGSLETLKLKFYQSLEYLQKYFREVSIDQLILLGTNKDGFFKELANALNIKTICMDIEEIYGHLEIMNLDNNYLMSIALAYKEVNKK